MSSCRTCGAPCQGQQCRPCELEEHVEDYYGVPEDNYDDEEGDE